MVDLKTQHLYRLHKRIEFVKKHKELFNGYSRIKGYAGNKEPIVKRIAFLARAEVGYSEKTVSCDIARSLYILYKIVKQNILI